MKKNKNIGEVNYWVEYSFIDTVFDRRCMNIQVCHTKEEAEKFVKDNNINDAIISEWTRIA